LSSAFTLFYRCWDVISRAVDWRVMLLSAFADHAVLAQLDLSDRQIRRYLYGDTAGMDSLIGVLFTFMLGFSMNFLPGVLSVRARRHDILVRRDSLAGADAMAADVERGVLDGTLDSGGVDPNGGAGDRAAGL